jgi:hypothetical protein
MRYWLTLLLAILFSTASVSADTPLANFLKPRGYKARLNPGSFNLVGDIYPDKDSVGMNRDFKFSECFPDLKLDAPEELENSTEVLVYDTSDVSLLLNIARKNPANSPEDVGKLEAAFKSNNIHYIALKATNLVHVGLSTGIIENKAKGGLCDKKLFQDRHFLVADAIGATTLSYDFLYDKKNGFTGSIAAFAGLLFKLGLSKSEAVIGSASFTNPVFIGFDVVQWDGKMFKPQ